MSLLPEAEEIRQKIQDAGLCGRRSLPACRDGRMNAR